MNKLFLLLACMVAQTSLNASHATQIIRRSQGGMGLPTLCVGDRFITIQQSGNNSAVAQKTQDPKKQKQTANEIKEQDLC